MNRTKVLKELQEPLQHVFESECHYYANSLEIYEEIWKKCKELEKIKHEFQKKKEMESKILELNHFFKSEEFVKIGELLNLSSQNLKQNLMEQFSKYKKDSSLDDKLENMRVELVILDSILGIKRKIIDLLEANLFSIIDRVYEANVKLEFPKKNAIAERIFILYFQEDNNFRDRREVIQVEDCKLRRDFLKAYTASTEKEKKEAIKWFEEEAEKMKSRPNN